MDLGEILIISAGVSVFLGIIGIANRLKSIKQCPFCKETVNVQATKCKHCGSEISQNEKVNEKKEEQEQKNNSD
jgi:rRNA maturation endonuclease Nob1